MSHVSQTIAKSAGSLFATPSSSVAGWVELCSRIAPVSSLILFAAPIPTLLQITKDKNAGKLPLLPYSSMAANAALWTTYGILRKESSIWIANGTGLLMAICYVLQFIRYCPSRSSSLPGSVRQHLAVVSTVFTASILISVLPFIQSPADIIGSLAVMFCMAMFTSPLSALKDVLVTKSASSIPLPLAVATVANAGLWLIAGVFKMKDINLIVPNAVGLASGLAQIALKVVYGNKPSPKKYDLSM